MSKADHSHRRLEEVCGLIIGLYKHDLHAKRVDALAAATLGAMTGTSQAVAIIGRTMAQAQGLMTAAGKPPKVILVAVARKLLVYAPAVVRAQKPFDPFPDAVSPA